MESTLRAVEGQARFGASEETVFLRVARKDDRIFLDLADEGWRVVEVDAEGWRVLDRSPVRFRRTDGMLPLPAPRHGGSINQLRKFLNITDDAHFTLAVAWILAVLGGRGPYPVLMIAGEQGTAKTSFMQRLRELVDPHLVDRRAPPKHDQDLFIAAKNSAVLSFDNLSRLPEWISDSLCRLATGGGFSTRALYTDFDEMLFSEMRPVILNAIECVIERPDLADRAMILTLEPLTDERRRPGEELLAEFAAERPQILGALLDAVSVGLRELADVSLAQHPRMADFARWIAACEEPLWAIGEFEQAYSVNRQSGQLDLLDADPVAVAVRKFMRAPAMSQEQMAEAYEQGTGARRGSWRGTADLLLQTLGGDHYTDHEARRDHRWPKTPRQLAGRLRRAAPGLREAGIHVDFGRTHGTSWITITDVPVQRELQV
jgi:hypothetical protein